MRMYTVTERNDPNCGAHMDACDPLEHPTHWVDVQLSPEFLAVLKTAHDTLKAACECEESADPCVFCCAAVDLEDAIERGQKPG